ncbi:MAG TPA: hypothetical protein VGJ65_23735, partial [Albitalea sp.]
MNQERGAGATPAACNRTPAHGWGTPAGVLDVATVASSSRADRLTVCFRDERLLIATGAADP